VNCLTRRLIALIGLLCLPLLSGVQAAEPAALLAFLRAYPQPAADDEAPAETAPRTPDPQPPQRRPLGQNDFYDPKNPDVKFLQHHDDATSGFPRDANGYPDWMRALRNKTIQPRSSLNSDTGMSIFDLDVVMKNTKEMPYVRFPHSSHSMWLDCSNCHPQPFEPRAGAAKIAMADIFRGKYCGMCHDRVAFITFFACDRCHSVPQTRDTPAPRK
jgi:c(7)-type cytochrome triheme protein